MIVHRLSPEAASELDDIWYYVAAEGGGVAAADRVVDAITGRFLVIASHPHIGRRRDDLRAGLRSFVVKPYVIFYRISADSVLILRVLHGRRDIAGLVRYEP